MAGYEDPLHIAASQGKLAVAQLLIESGANIEAQDSVRGVGALITLPSRPIIREKF